MTALQRTLDPLQSKKERTNLLKNNSVGKKELEQEFQKDYLTE